MRLTLLFLGSSLLAFVYAGIVLSMLLPTSSVPQGTREYFLVIMPVLSLVSCSVFVLTLLDQLKNNKIPLIMLCFSILPLFGYFIKYIVSST